MANVVAGDHDAYIRRFARDAKAFKSPVIVRFAHEGNGRFFPWGVGSFDNDAATYVAAWQHVHGIFREVGARNVSFLWSVAKQGCDGGCNPYLPFYPGDAFVDYMGFSSFNWGASEKNGCRCVRGFRPITNKLMEVSGKPIVAIETASNDDGGDKAAWITNGYTGAYTEFPRIVAIVYLNVDLDQGRRPTTGVSAPHPRHSRPTRPSPHDRSSEASSRRSDRPEHAPDDAIAAVVRLLGHARTLSAAAVLGLIGRSSPLAWPLRRGPDRRRSPRPRREEPERQVALGVSIWNGRRLTDLDAFISAMRGSQARHVDDLESVGRPGDAGVPDLAGLGRASPWRHADQSGGSRSTRVTSRVPCTPGSPTSRRAATTSTSVDTHGRHGPSGPPSSCVSRTSPTGGRSHGASAGSTTMPSTFVAAWRHVHDLFEEEGATNVRFLWSVGRKACPRGCDPYSEFYPGDAYVDYLGFQQLQLGRVPRQVGADAQGLRACDETALADLDEADHRRGERQRRHRRRQGRVDRRGLPAGVRGPARRWSRSSISMWTCATAAIQTGA